MSIKFLLKESTYPCFLKIISLCSGFYCKTVASVEMKMRTYPIKERSRAKKKKQNIGNLAPESGRTWKAVIQNQVTEDSAGADTGEEPAPPPLIFRPNLGPKGRTMFALRHSLIISLYQFMLLYLSYIRFSHILIYTNFFTCITQHVIFFLFLMMLLISSLRPYSSNILLYNVYSFDTMEFSIKHKLYS